MTNSKDNMDAQEKKIKQQAKDINPKKIPFIGVLCCYLFLKPSFSLLYAL